MRPIVESSRATSLTWLQALAAIATLRGLLPAFSCVSPHIFDEFVEQLTCILDVARFGSDACVIFKRQGLVAFEPTIIRGIDNMDFADRVAVQISEWHPDAVFIDQGNGTGVIDRLRHLGFRVTEVPFGSSAIDKEHFANRRVEMWSSMAQWLRQGGAIPPLELLQADLSAPTYGYTTAGKQILEPKDKIKERIGRSTDCADALALTFAAPVAPRLDPRFERQVFGSAEYDPIADFEREWRR